MADERERPAKAGAWYEDTAIIVALLLVVWPVGIVLAWRGTWPVAGKVAASVFVVAYVVFALLVL